MWLIIACALVLSACVTTTEQEVIENTPPIIVSEEAAESPEIVEALKPTPEAPIVEEKKKPTHLTVQNTTNTIITYLDIFTDDMAASNELGYNLLPVVLLPDDSLNLPLAEHPLLEEAILANAEQLFHVQAHDALNQAYYREWYPNLDDLLIVLSKEHRPTLPIADKSTNLMRIKNQTGFHIEELYILTPNMDRNQYYRWELLQGMVIPDTKTLDIPLEQLPYLKDYVDSGNTEAVLILAIDNQYYQLEKDWYPHTDSWVVTLIYDDYF